MEVRVATTVLERPALDDAAMKRISRRVARIRPSEEAISKQLCGGKRSFSSTPVAGQELASAVLAECLGDEDQSGGLPGLHYPDADAIVQAAQDLIT